MKPELRTVPHVDLPRYMGDWYVIANIPYFAEGDARHPGTRFLPLDNPPATPAPEIADWRFDVQALRDCLARDLEWKRSMGFPLDVRGLLVDVRLVEAAVAEQQPRRLPLVEDVVAERQRHLLLGTRLVGQGLEPSLDRSGQ